jgi:putative cell wall-binding protein
VSSKKTGLRRVGIVGLSTLVATSMMSIGAVTAQAAWATGGGDIGLVDTQPLVAGTQGATLVYPGTPGQALGDVRILIPNSFVNGDTIDLTVFDRTATATNAGAINTDFAHRLGFTSAPTVAVNSNPFNAAANVGPNSGSANNTEGTGGNAAVHAISGAATTAPVFTTTMVSSSRATGMATDIIRLTILGVAAAGTDPLAKWEVTLSGLTANVGTAVSPGELRVVPFAYDGAPNTTLSNSSLMFAGNVADQDNSLITYDPAINIYTVPAYVAPVSFNVGAPNNIVADGTVQSIGDISIGETNNYSLQSGTYTMTVGGAGAIDPSSVVSIAATGLTGTEAVSLVGVSGNVVTFSVANAVNTTKISITLSGLLLTAAAPGPVSYTLAGGSISAAVPGPAFLVTAGTSAQIGTPPPPTGVYADSAFLTVGPGSVNQTDIEAPGLVVNASASDLIHRIGGSDRWETAAKIAVNNGSNDYVVLASGMNFPDALSSAYLANQIGGGSILLTAPTALPVITATAMRELGTRTVFIVGGTDVISAGVEAQLKDTPQYYPGGHETIGQGKLNVVRLGGADRWATNQLVNQFGAAMGGSNPVGRTSITFGVPSKLTALVASGMNFPDALSAGPATAGASAVAVNGSIPLILTATDALSGPASSQIDTLGIQQAVIVGGTLAVSTTVETSITGKGVAVKRLGGINRYATSALVADFETAPVAPTLTTTGGLGFDSTGFTSQVAFLARGDVFADALAGAPMAGGDRAPILLTNSTVLSPETEAWLTDNAATYSTVIALGLGQAISNAVLDAANAAVATS